MNFLGAVKTMTVFSSKGSYPAQEDYVLCNAEKKIFIVADGFGGPVAGADAAKTACESVQNFLRKEAGDLEATLPFVLRSYFSLVGNVLFNALIHANRKVITLNKGKNVHEKGGASVLAGFMDGDLLALANVGACSAWLIRAGQIAELVIPRSYARLCDPFSGDPGLAVPLMAMGISEDLEPEIVEYRVRSGDLLLLQTDGVGEKIKNQLLAVQQKNIDSEEIKQILKSEKYSENATAAVMEF